ncbi:hypothetical protein M8C21_003472 [Ambrosia artemisiifolia]|uniref:Uncharacterized protein n=1 Tax=Ambrosia artemisiifolia TaxID=4212 RepID=A0AAD5CSZ7_AMBAR|nr:hypothetical protein M8C21_003472 [Ambrosia artemisiifolia]
MHFTAHMGTVSPSTAAKLKKGATKILDLPLKTIWEQFHQLEKHNLYFILVSIFWDDMTSFKRLDPII